MKRKCIAFIFTLAFLTIAKFNLYAQSIQIYKDGSWVGRMSQVADGRIEMNTEQYSFDYSGIGWYVTGGTIISGEFSKVVRVKWDHNASSHSLTVYETATPSNQTILTCYTDVDFDFNSSSQSYCSNQMVSVSVDIDINPVSGVYNAIGTTIKWSLRNSSGAVIRQLGQNSRTGNSVTGNISFIPDNIGIHEGTYYVYAECWRYNDDAPLTTSQPYMITIYPSAPSVSSNDIVFEEKVNNRSNDKTTTLSIFAFGFEGTNYSPGSSPSWPLGETFTVSAYTNNEKSPGNPGLNFLDQIDITNWDGLNQMVSNNGSSNLSPDFTLLQLTFEEHSGNNCAWQNSYTIPIPTYSITRPPCSTSTGSISISQQGLTSGLITYKLYECEFSGNNIINDRSATPYASQTQYATVAANFNSIPPGEYFVRIETSIFVIEEYINFSAYVMAMNYSNETAPTCFEGVNGSLTITSVSYNGINHSSSNNNTLPSGITFSVDGNTITPSSSTLNTILTGNSSAQLTVGSHSLALSVENCEITETIEIPPKHQNLLSATPYRPTCFNVNDGGAYINSLRVNNIEYNSIDYNVPENAITFHVYQGNTSFSFNAGDDFVLTGNGYSGINTLSGGTWNIYSESQNRCISDTIEVEIPGGPEFSLNYDMDLSIVDALCFEGSGTITLDTVRFDGVSYPSAENRFEYVVTEHSNLNGQQFSSSISTIEMENGTSKYLFIRETTNSCTSQVFELQIGAPTPLTVTQNNVEANCVGDNMTLIANVEGGTPYLSPEPPYIYKWKSGEDYLLETTNSLVVSEEGIYELEIFDANGCGYKKTVADGTSFTEKFYADFPASLDISVENATNSDGPGQNNGSVTLGTNFTESFVEYSKNGSDYQPQPFFNDLEPGDYTFYIRNENRCVTSIDTTIGEAPAFEVSLDSTQNVSCYGGSSGKVFMNATGGIPPYTFEITGNDGFYQKQTDNPVFTGLKEGTYTVLVSFTGAETYTDTIDNIVITEPDLLQADITDYVNAVCGQALGLATVTATGGTPDYTYQWIGVNNSQTTQTATGLEAGIHSIVVTDAKGCTATTSIQLSDPNGPILTQIGSTPALCSDSEGGGSATLEVNGGEAPYTITWEEIDATGLTIEDVAPGMYTATVTDNTNCRFQLSGILVPAPEKLSATLEDFKDPACYNDANGEITIAGNGGTAPYQYQWQNIEGNPTAVTVSGLAAGTYEVLITDDHNCTATESIPLNNPEEIIINLPDSVFICQGQTATLDAGNLGSLFEWVADNGFTSDQQIINVQEQGDYLVQVSNVEGCSNTAQTHVKFENRQFYATFLMSGEATMTDTVIVIELSKPQPDSVQWYITDDFMRLVDGNDYKELIPLQTGNYAVGMKAYFAGCEETVEKRISIIPADNSTNQKAATDALIQKAKLFPNPNTGQFEVEVNLAKEADISADVFSMTGMRMMPTKNDYGKKDYILGFNLMQLNPGVYFVNIMVEKEVRKLKFIVN